MELSQRKETRKKEIAMTTIRRIRNGSTYHSPSCTDIPRFADVANILSMVVESTVQPHMKNFMHGVIAAVTSPTARHVSAELEGVPK